MWMEKFGMILTVFNFPGLISHPPPTHTLHYPDFPQ